MQQRPCFTPPLVHCPPPPAGALRCSGAPRTQRGPLRCVAAYAPGLSGATTHNGSGPVHRYRGHEMTVSGGGPLPVPLSGAGGAAVAAAIEGAAQSGAGEWSEWPGAACVLPAAPLRHLPCAEAARPPPHQPPLASPPLTHCVPLPPVHAAAPNIVINVYAADPAAAVPPPGQAVPVKAILAPADVYAAVRCGAVRCAAGAMACVLRRVAPPLLQPLGGQRWRRRRWAGHPHAVPAGCHELQLTGAPCFARVHLQCAAMGAYKASQPVWKNVMLAVAAGCYTAMFG